MSARLLPVTPSAEQVAVERLGDEIAELAAHLHAGTHRLLIRLREFDRRNGWTGFRSCAHWLSWRTRISPGAAREKVRVARALASLPLIGAAMERGEFSFAVVRALSRVANSQNEAELVELARHATAEQVERIVRAWRRVDRIEERTRDALRHESRYVSLYPDADGTWVLRGRLEPEVGALLDRALQLGARALYAGRGDGATSGAEDPTRRAGPGQRRADAVGLIAEQVLGRGLVIGVGEHDRARGQVEGAGGVPAGTFNGASAGTGHEAAGVSAGTARGASAGKRHEAAGVSAGTSRDASAGRREEAAGVSAGTASPPPSGATGNGVVPDEGDGFEVVPAATPRTDAGDVHGEAGWRSDPGEPGSDSAQTPPLSATAASAGAGKANGRGEEGVPGRTAHEAPAAGDPDCGPAGGDTRTERSAAGMRVAGSGKRCREPEPARHDHGGGMPAETPGVGSEAKPEDAAPPEAGRIATSGSAPGAVESSGAGGAAAGEERVLVGRADRFLVVLHVDEAALRADNAVPASRSTGTPGSRASWPAAAPVTTGTAGTGTAGTGTAGTGMSVTAPATAAPPSGKATPGAPPSTPAPPATEPAAAAAPSPAAPAGHAALDDGIGVSAETARRLACDASRVAMVHASDGSVLDVGRRARTVPPALRRALAHRDRGCRFPGCNARFVDAHHINHWADGGETRLSNLISCCRLHHRLLHEEGWRVELTEEGDARFHRPDGRPLPSSPPLPPVPEDAAAALAEAHREAGLDVHPWTATPLWAGEPFDLHWAVMTLRR